jgi:DNA-binding response OmpR family regulator
MIYYPLNILVVEDNPHQAFAIEKSLQAYQEIRSKRVSRRGASGAFEEDCSAVILDYNFLDERGCSLRKSRRVGRTRSLHHWAGDEEIALSHEGR